MWSKQVNGLKFIRRKKERLKIQRYKLSFQKARIEPQIKSKLKRKKEIKGRAEVKEIDNECKV